MIGRAEIQFSEEQIVRAEHRLDFQMTIVERLQFGSESRYATLAEDLLYLMADRVAYLHKRHKTLLAALAAETPKPIQLSFD